MGVWKTLGKSPRVNQGQPNRPVQEGSLCPRFSFTLHRDGRGGWRELSVHRVEGSRCQRSLNGLTSLYQQQLHGVWMQTLHLRSRPINTGILQISKSQTNLRDSRRV